MRKSTTPFRKFCSLKTTTTWGFRTCWTKAASQEVPFTRTTKRRKIYWNRSARRYFRTCFRTFWKRKKPRLFPLVDFWLQAFHNAHFYHIKDESRLIHAILLSQSKAIFLDYMREGVREFATACVVNGFVDLKGLPENWKSEALSKVSFLSSSIGATRGFRTRPKNSPITSWNSTYKSLIATLKSTP